MSEAEFIPHWVEHFGAFYMAAGFIATALISFIPPPHEFAEAFPKAAPFYKLAYNSIQRLSLVRQRWNGNGKPKEAP